MRTRRSPRNQDRLFRELFKPEPQKAKPVEQVNRCWDCHHYPKGGRMDATCKLKGKRVAGRSVMDCFKKRPPSFREVMRQIKMEGKQ